MPNLLEYNQSKRSKLKWPFLTDSAVELSMYLFKVLRSPLENVDVRTGRRFSSEPLFSMERFPVALLSHSFFLAVIGGAVVQVWSVPWTQHRDVPALAQSLVGVILFNLILNQFEFSGLG